MKTAVLYAYPPEPDGLSLQGHMLYKGLKHLGEQVIPCNPDSDLEKEFFYKHFKPDVAIGVGYWGNTPQLIHDPLGFGITPVPWFVADGWIANYHEDLNKLPLILTTSNWVQSIYKRDGVKTNNMRTAYIGIDTNLFKPYNDAIAKERIRKMLGIEPHEKMILTVGGDVTSKGAQEMFKALAEIDKEFKDWKYICKSWPSECSHGHHEEEIKLIEELGLDPTKIEFLEGEYSNNFMPHLLNAADVYAAPSRLEGFGMIQVEAMACGTPVISIDAMGPGETIINNKTGFLARVADKVVLEEEWVYPWMGFPEKQMLKFDEPKVFALRAHIGDLARDTLKLLTDNDLNLKMGQQAREHAVQNFDYKVTSDKIRNIIKKELNLD